MLNPVNCRTLVDFLAPRTVYEYLFHPTLTRVLNPDIGGYLTAKASSFCTLELMEKYSVEIVPTNLKLHINHTYAILSHFDYARLQAFFSVTYRACQLVTTAIQHKIEQNEWGVNKKFLISNAVSLIPVVIIYLMGGPTAEILYACFINIAVSSFIYFESPQPYAYRPYNSVKELNFITATRNMNVKSFIIQNTFAVASNLYLILALVNLGTEDINILNILPNELQLEPMLEPDSPFIQQSASIQLCQHNITRSPYPDLIGTSSAATLLTVLIDQCGWLLGKIAVDGVFILLNQLGIVKDLRDPINSFSIQRAQPQAVVASRQQLHRASEDKRESHIATRRKYKAFKLTETQRPELAETLATQSSSQGSQPSLVVNEALKVTLPRLKHKKQPHLKPVVAVEKIEETALPSVIKVPNYSRNIVFLEGQGVQSLPNPWGVITYGVQGKEKQDITPYVKGLNTTHVGPSGGRGSIKYLGKSKKTGHSLYEIRPRKSEKRLLGILVRGEEDVYNTLKAIFGYERALGLTRQMQSRGEDISLIDFCQLVTHDQITDYVA